MENVEKIMKLADAEFGAIVQNGKFKSREEIDSVYKLMDIVKDGYEVMSCEDEMYGESYDDGYGHSMRGNYDGGMSYARGRRNARRDSMGRYSRDGRSYRGNSYGYSRDGKDEYREQLMDMLDTAPDEQTRQSIQRMIDNMK